MENRLLSYHENPLSNTYNKYREDIITDDEDISDFISKSENLSSVSKKTLIEYKQFDKRTTLLIEFDNLNKSFVKLRLEKN